jgi:hypothetical protein
VIHLRAQSATTESPYAYERSRLDSLALDRVGGSQSEMRSQTASEKRRPSFNQSWEAVCRNGRRVNTTEF